MSSYVVSHVSSNRSSPVLDGRQLGPVFDFLEEWGANLMDRIAQREAAGEPSVGDGSARERT